MVSGRRADNPLRCDCGAVWLWRLEKRASAWANNSSTPLEVQLPPCQQPDHLHGVSLSHLPADFCKSEETSASASSNSSSGCAAVGHSISVEIRPHSDAVDVQIRVERPDCATGWQSQSQSQAQEQAQARASEQDAAFDWDVSRRRFGTDDYVSANGSGRSFVRLDDVAILNDLLASTAYHICVNVSIGWQKHYHCREALTDPHETYPVAEIAVAASVSTSTTLVVVFMLCCCCPKTGCGKKDKHPPSSEHSVADVREEETQPIRHKTPPTERLRGDSDMWRQRLRRHMSDEESHQMFRATCQYLHQRASDPSQRIQVVPPVPGRRGPGAATRDSDYVTPNAVCTVYSTCVPQVAGVGRRQRPQTWTASTYHDFLAYTVAVPLPAPAATPLYALTGAPQRRTSNYKMMRKYNRPRLDWSAAKAEMHF